MKVLVWTREGETKVYSLPKYYFPEKLKEKVLKLVDRVYDNYSTSCLEQETTLSGIVEWVQNHTDDDDNFIIFEIVELEEL